MLKTLGEMGLYGPSLKGYGCAGVNNVAYGIAMQELERGDSGFRSAASVQGSLVMWPIYTYGSEEQKNKYLPKLASGEMIGCFGLTEPDHGSNPGGMITRATPDGDGWVLHGAKMWITNSPVSDVAVVWAKVREGETDTIRGFIVDADLQGFLGAPNEGQVVAACELHRRACLRRSSSRCRCSSAQVPEVSEGTPQQRASLRLATASPGVHWVLLRTASTPLVATRWSESSLAAPSRASSLRRRSWRTWPSRSPRASCSRGVWVDSRTRAKMTPSQVSVAKLNNVGIALDIARVSREVHGAMGITDEYPIMRHMMNLESVKTYEARTTSTPWPSVER